MIVYLHWVPLPSENWVVVTSIWTDGLMLLMIVQMIEVHLGGVELVVMISTKMVGLTMTYPLWEEIDSHKTGNRQSIPMEMKSETTMVLIVVKQTSKPQDFRLSPTNSHTTTSSGKIKIKMDMATMIQT